MRLTHAQADTVLIGLAGVASLSGCVTLFLPDVAARALALPGNGQTRCGLQLAGLRDLALGIWLLAASRSRHSRVKRLAAAATVASQAIDLALPMALFKRGLLPARALMVALSGALPTAVAGLAVIGS